MRFFKHQNFMQARRKAFLPIPSWSRWKIESNLGRENLHCKRKLQAWLVKSWSLWYLLPFYTPDSVIVNIRGGGEERSFRRYLQLLLHMQICVHVTFSCHLCHWQALRVKFHTAKVSLTQLPTSHIPWVHAGFQALFDVCTSGVTNDLLSERLLERVNKLLRTHGVGSNLAL